MRCVNISLAILALHMKGLNVPIRARIESRVVIMRS